MIRPFLSRFLTNSLGWHTNRRIVVIESDDWGSIRMPDKSTYDILLSKGIRVDNCPYNRYDSLASAEDLSALFEILTQFKDINGNYPVITANCLVANPDFVKIRETEFEKYHYELFYHTLSRFPDRSSSFTLWKEGISNNIFRPQFHGREHLNIGRWMKALRQNLPETRLAFDYGLFGISTSITSEKRKSYLAAFDYDDSHDEIILTRIIEDGLTLFKKIFEYESKSFIAPNFTWPSRIEHLLSMHGVKFIQGMRIQKTPAPELAKPGKKRHFMGQTNPNGQIYLIRNCQFEPSLEQINDPVDKCLAQIRDAFLLRKPAIVSIHRVNFIGSIDRINRERNLAWFKILLKEIKRKWHDVEFMSTDRLGDTIINQNKSDT